MSKKMNILFICNKSPWPPHEGGSIAMNNLIEGTINEGHNVKVLAINTNKYHTNPENIPSDYKSKTGIELVYIDLGIKPTNAFINLFTGKSYHVERFISSNFSNKLEEILTKNKFDIVQIETLFMSPYIKTIRKLSDASIVLRAHNIEHLIWKRVAAITKNPLKKAYLKHLSATLETYEKNILNKYDGIIPISKKDEEFFIKESNVPVRTISFGIDVQKLPEPKNTSPEHALFHIGAMNWIPNEEGISWFLEKVWPMVSKDMPKLKLYLAGREMPYWLKKTNIKNVVIEGEVPDAYDFINSKSISIAPLFSGSGIRIKIIESMAFGKAVISTSIGAEGISYTNGKNIIIANDPNAYADAIKKLYNDKELCKSIGDNAKILIQKEHNNTTLIKQMISFYSKLT